MTGAWLSREAHEHLMQERASAGSLSAALPYTPRWILSASTCHTISYRLSNCNLFLEKGHPCLIVPRRPTVCPTSLQRQTHQSDYSCSCICYAVVYLDDSIMWKDKVAACHQHSSHIPRDSKISLHALSVQLNTSQQNFFQPFKAQKGHV